MKVLYSWLKEFVDVPDGPAELGRRLSLRGLALEGLEPAPPGDEPPGQPAVADDAVLDFDVTANRPDCMSIVGIAREVAAVYSLPLRLPTPDASGHLSLAALTAVDRGTFSVALDAPELCPRYVGAAATVTVGPSPAWMQRRLLALGVRPISNVVDITNYVLLELGQPMHAFDHARLAGNAIVVRPAHAGETLTTLDGKTRTLTPAMLVIADGERAAAIGGVMGGLESEVRADSTRIVFESAWFKPGSVRATSKALGLRSEASMRFERGADPAGAAAGMARACALLEFIGAGTADGTMVDAQARPVPSRVVALTHAHVEGLLGMPVSPDEVERILAALGFTTQAEAGGDAWRVTVPGWRPDVTRPEDLIEEVGRHHGFEHLPATFPPVSQAPPPSDPRIARDAVARRAMLALGFSEAISFAFIEAAAAAPFSDGGAADRARQSALRDVRRDAAERAGRRHRRRQPQSPARPARRAPVRGRHRLRERRESAARWPRPGPARRQSITGAAAAGRSISSTSRAPSPTSARRSAWRSPSNSPRRTTWWPAGPPAWWPGRVRWASAACCRRRSPTAAASRAPMTSTCWN